MNLLSIEHLSKSYSRRQLFDDTSFFLQEGEKVGIIGINGTGKSTLLKIMAGLEETDEGTVTKANHAVIAYLPQHPVFDPEMTALDCVLAGHRELSGPESGQAEKRDHQDAAALVTKAKTMLTKLGVSNFDQKSGELAGGQRKRLALVSVLLKEADILLLDEPTNYLDAEHIVWLKRYLNEYENAFILISHDIPFLNSVINLIYHMDQQTLTRYPGDYDKFQEVYAARQAQIEAAYNRQQKEIADLKDFVARNKARVSTRNMAMSRQKKLDKMDKIELAAEKPKPEFHFQMARTPGRYIFHTKDLVIGYQEPLSTPLNLEMERGQKIVLTGANGIGKTTLLKSILGLIPPLSGSVEQGDYLSIGYFEQEMPPDIDTTCLEEIWQEFPSYTQYEVRSALAKCGLTTKHIESKVRVLSGGEQAKVRLCKLMGRESNVLVLDEPTNHLDVDAKAELARALKEYKGSILMVCHEPEFYEGLGAEVWDCTKWTTKV